MSIMKPELLDRSTKQIGMFCKDGRFDREIYWAGFGFQVWLQILTHILEAKNASILVIDEPDIYLHPDLQHRLLQILRKLPVQIIMATHAVELINASDHDEVVLIDKSTNQARRINDQKGLQDVLSHLGSTQNINLSKLARGKKALFFEGDDFKLWKKFAGKLGLHEIISAIDITVFRTDGITQWRKVEDAAWTFEKLLNLNIEICAIFDSDFNCDEAIYEFKNRLEQSIKYCSILDRKEIENYLLDSNAIARAIYIRLTKKIKKLPDITIEQLSEVIDDMLSKLINESKSYVLGQIVANRNSYYRRDRRDDSSIISETVEMFELNWKQYEFRINRCPGKQILRNLFTNIQNEFGVSVTHFSIIEQIDAADIPKNLLDIIKKLNDFAHQ